MFTSSSAANLAQQSHHLNHLHSNQQQQQHHFNQIQHGSNHSSMSTNQHFVGQPLFSLNHHNQHQNHGGSHNRHQPLQPQAQIVMPQFSEPNQHLAHFNHPSVTGHFAVDSLSVSDANQFATVMQQQASSHIHDASRFDASTLFQQHHSTTANQHSSNHQSQPQIVSANVITTNLDNFCLTNNGHVLINPTVNRLSNTTTATGILSEEDHSAIVMNTINNLHHHQQQQQQPPIISCNNASNNTNKSACSSLNNKVNSNRSSSGGSSSSSNSSSCSNLINSGSSNVLKMTTTSTSSNHNNIASSISINSHSSNHNRNNNNKSSNNKSSKSNGHSKRDKPEGNRNSESPRRIFECPTCFKGFTEKFNMRRHMQIHSQSRPKYICNECSKSFAWKDNFIRHKKAAHGTNIQYHVQ